MPRHKEYFRKPSNSHRPKYLRNEKLAQRSNNKIHLSRDKMTSFTGYDFNWLGNIFSIEYNSSSSRLILYVYLRDTIFAFLVDFLAQQRLGRLISQ